MLNKLRRLSYNQLVVLLAFLQLNGKAGTVDGLEKKTKLKGKSLGGVLSALSRTKFRGISLIEPVGKARDGKGLRWLLNKKVLDVSKAKLEVNKLLGTY
ncbi:MAG: hypothetical protein U9Q63_00065 [Patescibacteria group bacterium]|nr:hypothetical protein [Patescibacteria group bacterium]